MPSIEILLSPEVWISVLPAVIMLIAFACMLPLFVELAKEAIASKKEKNTGLERNAYHEGCETEGHILHPENTGDLINDENPFEQ